MPDQGMTISGQVRGGDFVHGLEVRLEPRRSHSKRVAEPVPAPAGLVDALHRAVRAWRHKQRRRAIQQRGMSRDWSWTQPAEQHIELYREMLAHG